jgi:hypothetical protein
MAKGPKERVRTTRIPLVRSPNFIAVSADGANISTRADEFGAVMSLFFVRNDVNMKVEKGEVIDLPDGGIRQTARPVEIEQDTIKTVECSVMMRLDHALLLAQGIIRNIQMLPPHVRAAYGIPILPDPITQESTQ